MQRAASRSAAGAAAYRGARKLVDPRTNAVYDYERRRGVVVSHIVVPGVADDVVGPQQLWGAVELGHKRKDAVVAREIRVSLPHQLQPSQREELTMTYARELSVRYGVAVDVCIHLPTTREGAGDLNHHAHLMMSACSVTLLGDAVVCGKKVETLDPIHCQRHQMDPICDAERERWCTLVNAALGAAGIDAVADHRSHRERGTGLLPEPKLGTAGLSNLHRWINSGGVTPLLGVTERWLDVMEANDLVRACLAESARQVAVMARLQTDAVPELPWSPGPSAETGAGLGGKTGLNVPPAPTTAEAMSAVQRLWASLSRAKGPDERRASWVTLRLVDKLALMQGGLESDLWTKLRSNLDQHAVLRQLVVGEVAARLSEIVEYESEFVAVKDEPHVPVVIDIVPAQEVPEAPTLERAMALMGRLDRVLRDAGADARRAWVPLRIADRRGWIQSGAVDPLARLRTVLSRDFGTRTEVVREIESRLAELDALELAAAGVSTESISRSAGHSVPPIPGVAGVTDVADDPHDPQAEVLEVGVQGNVGDQARVPVSGVAAIAAEFMDGYRGNVEVVIVIADRTASATPSGAVLPVNIASDSNLQKPDVFAAIAEEIHRRHGLRTLNPADRAAILEAIVLAADSSPGLRAAWADVNRRYPEMSQVERAEEVFAVAAQAQQGAFGRAWDSVLVVLARSLRAVGLLRAPVTMAELRSVARQIATGIQAQHAQVKSAAGSTDDVGARRHRHQSVRRTLPDISDVVALVLRLDAALPATDERRSDWATLVMLGSLLPDDLDRPAREELLRQILENDPDRLIQIDRELRSRMSELEEYERDGPSDEPSMPAPG